MWVHSLIPKCFLSLRIPQCYLKGFPFIFKEAFYIKTYFIMHNTCEELPTWTLENNSRIVVPGRLNKTTYFVWFSMRLLVTLYGSYSKCQLYLSFYKKRWTFPSNWFCIGFKDWKKKKKRALVTTRDIFFRKDKYIFTW